MKPENHRAALTNAIEVFTVLVRDGVKQTDRRVVTRLVREALEQGYRLALVASVAECEGYARAENPDIRPELMRVAIRIAHRAADTDALHEGRTP